MDRKTMKTVDMPKEFARFTPSDQHYIKKFEELNAGRASDMKVMRTRNKRLALLMGGVVMGICILSSLVLMNILCDVFCHLCSNDKLLFSPSVLNSIISQL